MAVEQLILSALVTGETSGLDRERLEARLRTEMQKVLGEFKLALKGDKVLVEDDLLGISIEEEPSDAPRPEETEEAMSFDGSIPPD